MSYSYVSMMIQPKCIVQLTAFVPHERKKMSHLSLLSENPHSWKPYYSYYVGQQFK